MRLQPEIFRPLLGSSGSLAPDGRKKLQELEKVAEEFEAIMIRSLMKSMRATVPQGKLLHGGRGEEIFSDEMDNILASRMAAQRGFGIAELLIKAYRKQVESEGGGRWDYSAR